MSVSADAALSRMAHEIVGLAVTGLHTLVAVIAFWTDFLAALTGPAQRTPGGAQ